MQVHGQLIWERMEAGKGGSTRREHEGGRGGRTMNVNG
jgi:hypothetical protein